MKNLVRFYLVSSIVLILLSIAISFILPPLIQVLSPLLVFLIWYFIFPYVMIFSFRLKKSDNPHLISVVNDAVKLFNMKMPSIFVFAGERPNAMAFGNLLFRGIAYTTSIVDALREDELLAVTAHELSHIRNHDMEIQVIALTLYSYFFMYLSNLSIFIEPVLFALVFPIFLFLHRHLEKRADISAVKQNRWLTRPLENALIKIGYLSITIPSYMLKDLSDLQLFFIKEQLRSEKENDSLSLFRSHPSIPERLNYLSKYEI